MPALPIKVVNKIFEKEIGKSMELYVDDILVKNSSVDTISRMHQC